MPDLCVCKDGSLTMAKEMSVVQKRTKAYGIALRVLAKKRPEEFKAIYARVLEEEYGLKAGHTNDVIGKYV
jgi:hypothetical protein